MSKKRPTYIEIIEERIEALEQRLSLVEEKIKKDLEDIQKYVFCLNLTLLYDMDMVRTIGDLWKFTSGEVELFNIFIDHTKKKEKVLKKLHGLERAGYMYVFMDPTWAVDNMIALSKFWRIPFESISSYLVKELGKDLAKKLVKKETILEHYGSNALSIWESLLKES